MSGSKGFFTYSLLKNYGATAYLKTNKTHETRVGSQRWPYYSEKKKWNGTIGIPSHDDARTSSFVETQTSTVP